MHHRNTYKTQIEEIDQKNRNELFKRSLSFTAAIEKRKHQKVNRNENLLKREAEKTTEMLNSLVLRMDEQVLL